MAITFTSESELEQTLIHQLIGGGITMDLSRGFEYRRQALG